MNNYPDKTKAELEQELAALTATDQQPGNHARPVPTAEELQTMRADMQADQSNNFLVFSALKAMEGLVHELQVHQVELEMQNRELREARQQLEASHQRYVDLYDFAPNGYVTLDEQGLIQEINLPGARLLGKERAYLIGKPFVVYVAKGESRQFREHLRRCQAGEESVTTELTLKGERARPVQLASNLRRAEAEQRNFYRTALLDISERRRAETTMRESEEKYRTLFESIDQGFCTIEVLFDETARPVDYRFLVVNPAFERQTGIENAVGRRMREIAPLNEEHWFEIYGQIALTGEPRRFENRAEQLHRFYEVYAWRVGEPAERKVAILFNDITERKRTEAALRESEARTAGIIETAMDGIITVDARQRIVLFNTAAAQMFQCPIAEAIGQPLDHFLPLRFRQSHQQHIANFGQTQVTKRTMSALGAIYGLRANGEEFPIEASISQIEAQGQKLFTVILRDITQRKQNERNLIEQATMLNQAQEAILVRDLDGNIRYWNQGAERLYGWQAEEVIHRSARELLYRGGSPQLEDAIRAFDKAGEWKGEIRQFTQDGRELLVEAHWTLIRDEQGQPISVLAINNDITEKKKLEAQFLRAQRLESLGTLAGGIAHDLNNIHSPVLMGVQMLQMKLTGADDQRWLEMMRGQVERGAEMIKQILLFARGAQGERVPLQIKHLIKELIKLLGETFPKSIEVKFSLPEALALVAGDVTQLQQVLMNLCVNARDAMPHGGTLLLEADNFTVDTQYAALAAGAQPGPYVAISISDTGAGIPAAIKDKIFDPFFTTKELGHGTGLGLSTVLGIVKSHCGFINVYSEAGKGTKFTVYLPAYTAPATAQSAVKRAAMPAGQGELILVVDDEAAVREITRVTLETFGYRVLTASDGTEAVMVYAQHADEIQAVLTDMMMPNMDGPAAIRALQKLNPQIKVIASSGLAEQERVNEVAALGVRHFLPKPYTADRLLRELAEVLRTV